VLFPITSQPPRAGRLSVEIPEIEKRRAGLDPDMRLWIMLDEINTDRIGPSPYIGSDAVMGRFSRAFYLPAMQRFIQHRARARNVDRMR
jgi:hypothetical protein